MSQSPKISTKKSLVTPEQQMSEKIQKVDPPPPKKKGPFFWGGGLKSSVVFKRDLACYTKLFMIKKKYYHSFIGYKKKNWKAYLDFRTF